MSGHALRAIEESQGEHLNSCSQQRGERSKENHELRNMSAVESRKVDRLQVEL